MSKIFKNIDKAICLLCVLGFILELSHPKTSIEIALGIIGLIYCSYYIYVCIFCPIRRDWILAKGKFLLKVVNFVLLVPFVVTTLFYVIDQISCASYSPKNLIYDSNLYESEEVTCDTVQIFSLRNGHNGEQVAYIPVENGLSKGVVMEQESPSLFWTIYYHYIDPGNQHMTTSESGRKRAAMVAILGYLLLNGLLMSTLISWFDRRRSQWYNGEIRYKRRVLGSNNHAIVIGANESTPTIVKKLLEGKGEKPVKYVVLLTNENVENVREQILSYLENQDSQRLIVYNGQLDSIEEIYKLNINLATEIYVLGENSSSSDVHEYHDTQNMKCVHNIASYLTDKCVEHKVVCRVLFEYQTTYSVFKFSDLPDNIKDHLTFIPFNTYEDWAQRVLVNGEYVEMVKKIAPQPKYVDGLPILFNRLLHRLSSYINTIITKVNDEERVINYTPLDGEGITQHSKEHVHLVVVGMSKMGIAMALQAAQVVHYPNFTSGIVDSDGRVVRNPSMIRTKITFIDENADREMWRFMAQHQHLFALARYRYVDASVENVDLNVAWIDRVSAPDSKYKHYESSFLDIEWEFVKGRVEGPGVRDYLRQASADADPRKEGRSLLTIAVCHPLADDAIAASIYMPGEVYDNAQEIFVYQRESSEIVYNLSIEDTRITHKRYAKLRPFGMQYADFTMDKWDYYRAKLCNYVYAMIFDDDINNEMIPQILSSLDISDHMSEHVEKAHREWKSSLVYNKWSNRYLANSFESKIRSVGGVCRNIAFNYDMLCRAFEANKEVMAECEHNRWNVQQLLMGFRAYKDHEFEKFLRLKSEASTSKSANAALKAFKKEMKQSAERVHLNICSMQMLSEYDPSSKVYDEVLNRSIPAVMKCVEREMLRQTSSVEVNRHNKR